MAVLKDLIVHGPSRFLNKAYFDSINADSVEANKGIFNKLIAKDSTLTNATVVGLLDVSGELHTKSFTNSNIATIDGSFYITPTLGLQGGNTTTNTVTVSANSLSFSNANGTAFSFESLFLENTTSPVAWSTGSSVIITGEIQDKTTGEWMPLGTLKGTLQTYTSTSVVINNIKDSSNGSAPSTLAAIVSSGTTSGLKYRNIKVSLISVNRSGLKPLGIFMTATGSNGKTFLDIYGGSNAESNTYGGLSTPVLRIGNLNGLPAIQGVSPTGWGIYTTNGFFSGTVAADRGKIGGWNIGTDNNKSLYTGTFNSNGGIYISPSHAGILAAGGTSSQNWAFTAGNAFGVTTNGKLYATGADIGGAIKAQSLTIGSNATINDTSGLISNSAVEVGGRNLVWDTEWKNISTRWTDWGTPTTREIVTLNGKQWLHLVTTANSYQGYSQNWTNRENPTSEIQAGDTIVFSYTAYAETVGQVCTVGCHWNDSSGSIVNQNWFASSLTTTPKRYTSQPFTVPANAVKFNVMIGQGIAQAQNLYITEVKIEKGNKATDWTPAPEDVASDIEDASKVADNYLKFEPGENGGLMVADLNGASNTTIHGINTRNVLIDDNSVNIREGQHVLASFGEKTVIGEDTNGHSRIFIDPSSSQSGITNIFRVVSKNNINAHQIILDDNNLSNNVPVVIETPYWTDGIGSSSDPLTTTSRTSTPATFVIDEMDEIPNGQEFKVEVLLTTYKKSSKLSYGHPESCVIPFTKGSSGTVNQGLDVFSGTVLYTVKLEYTAPKTFKLTVSAKLASTTSGVSYWLSISEICALYHTQQELVPVHKMHGDVYLNSGGLGRTWIGLESILNSSTGQAVYGNDADFHNMLLSYGWTHGRINDFDLKELLYDLICTVPIGTIEMYGGSTLPTGWLFCYGQPVNRWTYSALFEVIGTSFGEGDGSTTFNLPDLRGRFPLGVGNGTAAGHTNHKLNDKGGSENAIVPYHRHGLNGENAAASSANASHTHATGAGTHYMTRDTDSATSTRSAVGGSGKYTWTSGSASGFLSSTNTASANAAHGHSLVGNTAYAPSANSSGNTTGANMPPYIGLRFIIYTGLNRKDSGDQIE